LSQQSFLLAIKASISALGLPFASRVKNLFFLSIKFAIFELATASVA
jgi:hypothetical protein